MYKIISFLGNYLPKRKPKLTPEQALEEFHRKIERARQLPVAEAEKAVGVKGFEEDYVLGLPVYRIIRRIPHRRSYR